MNDRDPMSAAVSIVAGAVASVVVVTLFIRRMWQLAGMLVNTKKADPVRKETK